MFEPSDAPRVFGVPPGADFPTEVVVGLLSRVDGQPPEALARITILVNTRRMQRRLRALLSDGAPRLLPRIGLVTDLDALLPAADLPPAVSPLRRRLDLSVLIGKLLDAAPDLAPRAAAVDLADSLAILMDEMQGEDVPVDALLGLDIDDMSGHWARSLQFLSIVRAYTDRDSTEALDPEARRRKAAEVLVRAWTDCPPTDPVIVAGSTGSRGTTAMIMQAVSRLPQGAILLPGFDFDLPDAIFAALPDTKFSPQGSEDHPQFRLATFVDQAGIAKRDVLNWTGDLSERQRNPLISLALRPAPVTDQWLSEGPGLGALPKRTEGMAFIEAPEPKHEALAIAVALREAIENGKTAALITPDRTLGRRVTAALLRWDIVPDDSAGRPLSLTAPGRFLRQVAALVGQPANPVDLIALLKHPLTWSGGKDRGPNLRMTRELELFLRRIRCANVTSSTLSAFRQDRPKAEQSWCHWLENWLDALSNLPAPTLEGCLKRHLELSEALASGGSDGSGALWEETAGRDTRTLVEKFHAETDHPGRLPFAEYARLLDQALSAESTRNYDTARPDVMIWGTLEARVQGADVVILGGLNEGVWPEQPAPDPWLNRRLRRDAGLLLPERQIGLSAHDFQQAVCADQVILSRAMRDADSETVPSRWVSRLTNLLKGLTDQDGPNALASMRAHGESYLDMAARLTAAETRIDPAPRPSPAPPKAVRPTDYTVTEIQRLIRDPYAIYARHILKLTPLNPLRSDPDARLRGEVFHRIVERVFCEGADFSDLDAAAARLRETAQEELSRLPWPGVAAHWFGHLDAIAPRLVSDEQARRQRGTPVALEGKGRIDISGTRFSLRGKADRIDRLTSGKLAIYDYKTGGPPSAEQIKHFDRQLPIEAVMAEHGGFDGLAATPVEYVAHIGLGRIPKERLTPLIDDGEMDLRTVTIAGELARLLTSFDSDLKGYPARRAMEKLRFDGDYDHLARFGEWDDTSDPVTERLP